MNKPEIRFEGFADDWMLQKLGDLGNVLMNRRIYKGQTTESGEVPFYKIGTFGGIADAFISRTLFNEYKKKYPYPKIGDLLISAAGSIGKVVEYIGADEYFQDSNIVWLNHDERLLSSFLKQFYTTIKWGGLEGSTLKRLYNKDILEMMIKLPVIAEQTAIGNFFNNLDNTIAQKKQQQEKLQTIKKAMLEKMFPQKGENVPEIRFDGFSGKWEARKLSEVVGHICTGKLDANAMSENGKYDFYTSGIQKYKINYHAFEGPAITIAGNGATVGYMHLADGKFNAYQRTYVLTDFKVDRQFLFSEIGNKLPIKITEEVRASNIPYIVIDMLTELKVVISKNEDEQTAIGNFFRNLDTLIEAQQEEIEKLQGIKNALLNKMFV